MIKKFVLIVECYKGRLVPSVFVATA